VEFDSSVDGGDGGFAGLAGGEVAGFLGAAGGAAVRALSDVRAWVEDFQEDDGDGEVEFTGGEMPRRCPSRRPGRLGS
jgi:hypothetical protein